MLADDLGFSDLGCYGCEIPTPNIDALAGRRAALHQLPRVAAVLADPGGADDRAQRPRRRHGLRRPHRPRFPRLHRRAPRATSRRWPRCSGPTATRTFAVGKWHLCKDSDLSEAGDQHSWPLQRGFDQYYGFLEALTNFHHPHRLVRGQHASSTSTQYPDGYYLTDDLTDRAVRMIREVEDRQPGQAVLPVLRPRRRPRPAARQARRHRGAPRPLRRRLGRDPRATARPPDRARHRARRHRAAAAQHRTGRGRRRLGRADRRRADACSPATWRSTPRWSPPSTTASAGSAPTLERARRARQHHLHLHQRQRRLARGPDTRQHRLLPRRQPDRAGDHDIRRRRTGAARRDRRPDDLAALPAGLGDGLQHPVPAVQDHHVPRRPPGPARPLLASRASRAPARSAASTRTSPTSSHPRRPPRLDLPTSRDGLPADRSTASRFVPDPRRPPSTPRHTPSSTTSASATVPTTATAGRRSRSTTTEPVQRRPLAPLRHRRRPNAVHDLADEHPERVAELVDAWEEAAWANQVFPLDEGAA